MLFDLSLILSFCYRTLVVCSVIRWLFGIDMHQILIPLFMLANVFSWLFFFIEVNRMACEGSWKFRDQNWAFSWEIIAVHILQIKISVQGSTKLYVLFFSRSL